MELLELTSPNSIPIFVFFGVTVLGLLIGGVIAWATNDSTIIVIFGVAGALIGVMLSAGVGESISTNNTEKVTSTFEAAYGVSIVEGDLPETANQSAGLIMFTQDGGPFACLVTTDDVEYTVTCDGKEVKVGVHVDH